MSPEIIDTYFYKPERVTEFLGLGASSFIGVVDEMTVFKIPKPQATKKYLRY